MMKRKRVLKKGEQDSRIIDTLYRVVNFIGYVRDLHRLLELVMQESKEVMNAEASSLMLYDEATDELYFEIALGEKAAAIKRIRLKRGEGIAGTAAEERKSIVVNDVARDARHFKQADTVSAFTTRNLIATPMIRGDRLIGVLEVLNKANNEPFTEDDTKVLEFFAAQAAIAIENARLIQENVRSERLVAVGQAVASLSHYIKNIISGLEGSISLVDDAISQDEMETISEIWPVFKRSSTRISRLVREMLNYSRPSAPEFSEENINHICSEIHEANLATAQSNNLELLLATDDAIPCTMLDIDKIHDTILNLVSNAIDATKGNGTKVEIATRLYPSDNVIEVKISDDGAGINEENQHKIFEPFFTTKGTKGSGLGLAIVKKNIEEHEGTIRLESEVGVGTTFVIRLPLKNPEEGKEQKPDDD